MSDAAFVDHVRQWIGFLWLALAAVWLVTAFATKQTVVRQSRTSRLWQTAIMGFGLYLLFWGHNRVPWLDRALLPASPPIALASLAIVICGLGFGIWARLTIGANWSGAVTVKKGHTLVQSGPYLVVRHPIYTGLLLALLGSAFEHLRVRGALAVLVCGFAFWLKILTEERMMVQHFGQEYVRYRHQVRALVPFVF